MPFLRRKLSIIGRTHKYIFAISEFSGYLDNISCVLTKFQGSSMTGSASLTQVYFMPLLQMSAHKWPPTKKYKICNFYLCWETTFFKKLKRQLSTVIKSTSFSHVELFRNLSIILPIEKFSTFSIFLELRRRVSPLCPEIFKYQISWKVPHRSMSFFDR